MKKELIILNLLLLVSTILFSQKNESIQVLDSTSNVENTQVLNTEITIYFDFNSCDVNSRFYQGIDKFIENLAKTKQYNVLITGHTDDVGSDEDNNKLGLCRANSLKKYILSKGIVETRIKVNSKGEKIPIADNSTDEGAAKNRRVVLNLVERK